MRSSTLAAGLLYLCGGGASAFCPTTGTVGSTVTLTEAVRERGPAGARTLAAPRTPGRGGPALHAWYDQPAAAGEEDPDAAANLELMEQNVVSTLQTFVKSEFAIQTCQYFNLNPATYGELGSMFEYVKLDYLPQGKIIIKLKERLNEKNEHVMRTLSRSLRADNPNLVQIHSVKRDGRDVY